MQVKMETIDGGFYAVTNISRNFRECKISGIFTTLQLGPLNDLLRVPI